MSDNALFNGLANRGSPIPVPGDNTRTPIRTSRTGELITSPLYGSKIYPVAQQGAYFAATNATLGTAIVGKTAPTALSDTAALLFLRNDPSNNRQIMLDYIELMVTAVGTSGTDWQFSMQGDKGSSRYTAGGTTITPVNVHMGSTAVAGIDANAIRFGDLTLAAATSSARLLHHGLVRTVIKVAGDKYVFKFGDSSPGPVSGIAMDGTSPAAINIPCPPIVLDPGDAFIFREVATAQTVAASYQIVMGFVAVAG